QQVVELGFALEDVHKAPRLLIAPPELGFEPVPPRQTELSDLGFCFGKMAADLDHVLDRLLAEGANSLGVLGESLLLSGAPAARVDLFLQSLHMGSSSTCGRQVQDFEHPTQVLPPPSPPFCRHTSPRSRGSGRYRRSTHTLQRVRF